MKTKKTLIITKKHKVPWFTKTFYTKAFCTVYMRYCETRGLYDAPLKLLSIIQLWWEKLISGLSAIESKGFCLFVCWFFCQGKVQGKKEDTQNLYLKEYFDQDCYCYSEMKPIDSMPKLKSVFFSLSIRQVSRQHKGSNVCTDCDHLVHNPPKTFLSSRA